MQRKLFLHCFFKELTGFNLCTSTLGLKQKKMHLLQALYIFTAIWGCILLPLLINSNFISRCRLYSCNGIADGIGSIFSERVKDFSIFSGGLRKPKMIHPGWISQRTAKGVFRQSVKRMFTSFICTNLLAALFEQSLFIRPKQLMYKLYRHEL